MNWPNRWFYYGMILFGLFILYQIIRNILGGSWGAEAFIAALVILNLSICFNNSKELAAHKAEFREFKRSMQEMTKDFKEFRKETQNHFSRLNHLMK